MTCAQQKDLCEMRHRGLSYAQIAATLGLSVNTIKSYCRRNGVGGGVQSVEPKYNPNHCQHCGKPLHQLPGIKPRKFCSDACRHIWWHDHRTQLKRKALYRLTCTHCGVVFESYGNQRRKYCGHPCYTADRFRKEDAYVAGAI